MNTQEWKEYYVGMIRNGIRPHKVPEMIARCGGLQDVTELKEGKPVKRKESQDEAKERLANEIRDIPFKVGDRRARKE